ncbi:MAG: DUF2207 domain-containing protein, partial [Patescibacteria group bacterium]
MKKFFIVCALAGCMLPGGVFALTEQIQDFSAEITVERDSTLTVTERIEYDFSDLERHGIFRNIPYQYTQNGTKYATRVNIVSVTDTQGDAYEYSSTRSGGYVKVKIGDPEQLVSGSHTYVITYTVQRAVTFSGGQSEIYWNITGNEWDAPIVSASAILHLPAGTSPVDWRCYTGVAGATDRECEAITRGDIVAVEAQRQFSSYEGMTMVVTLPAGALDEPVGAQKTIWFLQDNFWVLLPVIAFFILHRNWRKKGKDPRINATIIPEYESPDRMPPAELGTLWDERADTKDISATFIDFAVKGYITIKGSDKKNYEFVKIKNADAALTASEKAIFESLFPTSADTVVKLDSLKNTYYTKLPDIKKALYEALVQRNYYAKNPNSIKVGYAVFGTIVIGGSIATGFSFPYLISAWLSIFVTGVLIIIYGGIMPQKTVAGAEALQKVKGFKWFLSVTETERLKFHNPPTKTPEQFEKLLPYAMVLGVEKEWAKQFEGIDMPPPSWYQGSYSGAYTSLFLASSLSDMRS